MNGNTLKYYIFSIMIKGQEIEGLRNMMDRL